MERERRKNRTLGLEVKFFNGIAHLQAKFFSGIAHLKVKFFRDIAQMRGTNVWTFIMYGLLFDMVNSLWRPFSVRFLERLGGGEFEIALLSSLPGAVAAIVLLPGAIIFRRFTNKKRATAAFILISRAMLLAIALIPALPAAARPLLFVVLVALMNFPDALSQTSLQSLLGTVFNGNIRGQAIALRTKFGQAVIPVVTILAGLAITYIPNANSPYYDSQRMFLYQIFFVGAFAFGVLEVFVFNKISVPERRASDFEKLPSVSAQIKKIFADKRFRRFFIPALCFIFTWQAAWPLVNIFIVINLEANELWLAIIALVGGGTAFFSSGFWQKLLRKKDNSTVFVLAAALLAGNMFIFPLVPNMQIMALVHIVTGFSVIGINTALLNGVLEATPDENRMLYLAVYNTAQNLSLFAAPFFAHFLFTLVGIHHAMFIIGGMRIAAAGFVWVKGRAADAD
jgi:predicted MFS family arabinose efflux permease